MKERISIFSNSKTNHFFSQLCFEYELIFKKFNEISFSKKNSTMSIVFLSNDKDLNSFNFNDLNEYYLVITSIEINKLNLNNKFKLVSAPITIKVLKNEIRNILQNINIKFHDICITNEKLTNVKNNIFCYLTSIEKDILEHLIKEKETQKSVIKENILKIKSNLETNSLESHLTRIRKKMNTVKTSIKIKSKNDKLYIIS